MSTFPPSWRAHRRRPPGPEGSLRSLRQRLPSPRSWARPPSFACAGGRDGSVSPFRSISLWTVISVRQRDCLTKPWTMERPRPVTLAFGLGGEPESRSNTAVRRLQATFRSAGVRDRDQSHIGLRLNVQSLLGGILVVKLGVAGLDGELPAAAHGVARALTARFSRAVSTWVGSTCVFSKAAENHRFDLDGFCPAPAAECRPFSGSGWTEIGGPG